MSILPFFASIGISDISNYNISDHLGITNTGKITVADLLHKISEEGDVASTVSSDIVDMRSHLPKAQCAMLINLLYISSTTRDKIFQFSWGKLLIHLVVMKIDFLDLIK